MSERIYLDNNATTRLDQKALAAMLNELEGPPANPSSIHFYGQKAKRNLQKSRDQIAKYFNCFPEEVIFTSGGTESLNMCIKGLLPKESKGTILTSEIEHAAILHPLQSLKTTGHEIQYMPCNAGYISPKEVELAIDEKTALIVLSAVNSETGITTDIESIAKIAKKHDIPFIVDGVALLGKEAITSIPDGITAICFSGHKFHAPKGIGFVILRDTVPFTPLITGGHQEFNKRAGTENIPAIVGLNTALELIFTDASFFDKIRTLRDLFEKQLLEKLPDSIIIHGKETPRVSNTSNICFKGVSADEMLICLDRQGISASHGSACSSGSLEPSRVLLKMGIDREFVKSSIRFSLSRYTTYEEIEKAINIIVKIVTELQS